MDTTTTKKTKAIHRTAKPLVARSATDEQLLARYCQTGDWRCFEQLVQRYERELYSYLRRYLGSAEMAEDAFQATFLQIHLKGGTFDESRRFRPWLYTIATNQAIDAQRRNRRHRGVSLDQTTEPEQGGALADMIESEEPSPAASLSQEERSNWVRGAVAELPEHLRAVIELVYHQGLKYREAAEVLDIPVGTIKSRMNAAIGKLGRSWNRSHASEP